MNLQPFYDLRERLHAAANAGVNLMMEDFRLKRAAAAIEPFAKAAPVFKKIDQMVKQLMDASCENRSLVLLDTLALLDAVLVTQGTMAAPGDLEPLGDPAEDDGFFEHYQNISYGVLHPLQEAMTGTGSGRYHVLVETHKSNPELFDDYRIGGWLVQCLGDSYSDIADTAAFWLREKGESILPALKQNFDPAGKKEMVRRVDIITSIAGAKENDFYLEQLPNSEKAVREALIEALHFEPENAEMIFGLLKSERGRTKASAQWASSFMDSEAIRAYWKKTASAAKFFEDTEQAWAIELLADQFVDRLDKWIAGRAEEMDTAELLTYTKALKGKVTKEYGRIAKKLAALCEKVHGDSAEKGRKKSAAEITPSEVVDDCITELMVDGMIRVAAEHPEAITAMAEVGSALYEQYGEAYLHAAFTVSLCMEPADVTFDKFSPYITQRALLPAKRERCRREAGQMMKAIGQIQYDREKQCYQYYYPQGASWKGDFRRSKTFDLPNGFDMRWYSLIFKYEWKKDVQVKRFENNQRYVGFDALLYALFRTDIEELRKWYGSYYYQKACVEAPYTDYVDLMMASGWTKVDGILKKLILAKEGWAIYAVRMVPGKLGLTAEQTIRELEEAKKQVKSSQQTLVKRIDVWIEQLKLGKDFSELM